MAPTTRSVSCKSIYDKLAAQAKGEECGLTRPEKIGIGVGAPLGGAIILAAVIWGFVRNQRIKRDERLSRPAKQRVPGRQSRSSERQAQQQQQEADHTDRGQGDSSQSQAPAQHPLYQQYKKGLRAELRRLGYSESAIQAASDSDLDDNTIFPDDSPSVVGARSNEVLFQEYIQQQIHAQLARAQEPRPPMGVTFADPVAGSARTTSPRTVSGGLKAAPAGVTRSVGRTLGKWWKKWEDINWQPTATEEPVPLTTLRPTSPLRAYSSAAGQLLQHQIPTARLGFVPEDIQTRGSTESRRRMATISAGSSTFTNHSRFLNTHSEPRRNPAQEFDNADATSSYAVDSDSDFSMTGAIPIAPPPRSYDGTDQQRPAARALEPTLPISARQHRGTEPCPSRPSSITTAALHRSLSLPLEDMMQAQSRPAGGHAAWSRAVDPVRGPPSMPWRGEYVASEDTSPTPTELQNRETELSLDPFAADARRNYSAWRAQRAGRAGEAREEALGELEGRVMDARGKGRA